MVTWANRVTIARILAIPLFIIILYLPFRYKDWVAALVFCIIATSDAVDGWLARKKNELTRAGAVLDPLADKLLVAAALIFLIGRIDAWMAYVIIAREFLVTGLRILAKKIVEARWLGKLKTLSQMVGVVAVLINFQYAWHLMLVATILTVLSGFDYFWQVRKSIRI
jgi:CDP-diacylglycerol--glycerol-3-phosphate 3-phosphatidyltransferase